MIQLSCYYSTTIGYEKQQHLSQMYADQTFFWVVQKIFNKTVDALVLLEDTPPSNSHS